MPTILDRLAALFSRDMRAVLRNPRAISMIENPSERVQLAAVQRDKSVICFIDKPTEKVQLAAVRNAPHNIHFIASPSERVQLSVIRNKPVYIGFLSSPTERVQMIVVEKRPECISLIKKPAEKVQLMAVLRNPHHIASIREPAEKVQLAAVQKKPEYIRYIEEPTAKVQHMAIEGNPDILQYIKSPAESVQLAAVQAKGENIRYLSAPSETVQFVAVRSNPQNIRYIENPSETAQLSVLHADRNAALLIKHPSDKVKKQAEEVYGFKLESAAKTKQGTLEEKGKATETIVSGKKRTQTAQKNTTVKTAAEKLDEEIKKINNEYEKTVHEIWQKRDVAFRDPELRHAEETMNKQLTKAFEQFNSTSTSGKKGCNVESIIRDLRKEGVKVESMQAAEWHALMRGKSISPTIGSSVGKAAAKKSALMLSKTPVGYTLKAIGAINRMSRQASADM